MSFNINAANLAELIGAILVLGGIAIGVVRWVFRQNKQDDDIKDLKEENTIVCYALKACLDGLEQLGANHTVPKAKNDLEKYLNKKAHEQTEGSKNR